MKTLNMLIATVFVLGAMAGSASAAAPEKWTKYCTKCHGDDGKGKTKMGEKLKVGDMTAADWQDKRKNDADMKKKIREGNTEVKMPAFGTDKVSDAEIDELVKFIRSLKQK